MDGLMGREVLLGRRTITVTEQPFRVLKTLLPRMNRVAASMSRQDMSEAVLDEMLAIVAACAGVEVTNLQDEPIKAVQLVSAFMVVADVSGLAPSGSAPDPNAQAATGSTGMTSTPSSPLQPAGPGL